MALQILNLSIDTQNFQPPEPKNTLCYFNEMNSIVELVTEKLITKKDTFPENRNENKSFQAHKHTTINTLDLFGVLYVKIISCIVNILPC